jgi:hypothetical protein
MVHIPRALVGALLAAALSTAACAVAPVDPPGASGEAALASEEQVNFPLLSGLRSTAPSATGVDTWDFVVVANGNERYVVAIGYKEQGAARLSVVELVFQGHSLTSEDGKVSAVARSANPAVPLTLSSTTRDAIARDISALSPQLQAAVREQCTDPRLGALVTLLGMGGVFGAMAVCTAATGGACALAVVGAGALVGYDLKGVHVCATR